MFQLSRIYHLLYLYLWIISGLSISADLLQQRCSSGPAAPGTTATAHCSNSNNCHCCYPKRDQTGTKLLPMLPLILEHGSDSSSSAVCSGQVTTRSRPTSMVIAGKQMMRVRVDMVGMIHDDLLTQWRHIPMGQFSANIFLIQTTSNYLWASEVFKNQRFKSHLFSFFQ